MLDLIPKFIKSYKLKIETNRFNKESRKLQEILNDVDFVSRKESTTAKGFCLYRHKIFFASRNNNNHGYYEIRTSRIGYYESSDPLGFVPIKLKVRTEDYTTLDKASKAATLFQLLRDQILAHEKKLVKNLERRSSGQVYEISQIDTKMKLDDRFDIKLK